MGSLQTTSGQNALSVWERERLDVVAHTLTGLHANQAIQFFRERPALLLACLHHHYPLDANLIRALGKPVLLLKDCQFQRSA